MPGGGSANTKQTKGREMNSPAQAISGEKYHHTRTESSVQKYAGNRRIKGVSIQYRTAISRSRKHFAEIHGHDRESKKSKKSNPALSSSGVHTQQVQAILGYVDVYLHAEVYRA
jgi:hypothetical protein